MWLCLFQWIFKSIQRYVDLMYVCTCVCIILNSSQILLKRKIKKKEIKERSKEIIFLLQNYSYMFSLPFIYFQSEIQNVLKIACHSSCFSQKKKLHFLPILAIYCWNLSESHSNDFLCMYVCMYVYTNEEYLFNNSKKIN